MSWHFSYVSFALKWACTSRSNDQVSDLIPYIPLHSTPKPQVREAGHHTKERTEDQACAGALDEGGRREVRVWRQFHTPFCPTLGATYVFGGRTSLSPTLGASKLCPMLGFGKSV